MRDWIPRAFISNLEIVLTILSKIHWESRIVFMIISPRKKEIVFIRFIIFLLLIVKSTCRLLYEFNKLMTPSYFYSSPTIGTSKAQISILSFSFSQSKECSTIFLRKIYNEYTYSPNMESGRLLRKTDEKVHV